MIFGVGQTISSGFFLCLDGFRLVKAMGPEAMTIYIGKCYDDFPLSAAFLIFSCLDELDSMYRGQAHDLYWTSNGLCPTEEEYLSMIDASKFDCAHHISLMANMTCFSLETSALFRLASRLSRAEATKNK